MADSHSRHEKVSHAGFSLSVTANDVASTEKYFNAPAQRGEVSLSFQKTFRTDSFGMLADKFGVPWMVNVQHHGDVLQAPREA